MPFACASSAIDNPLAFKGAICCSYAINALAMSMPSLQERGPPQEPPPVAGLAGFRNTITDDAICLRYAFTKRTGHAILVVLHPGPAKHAHPARRLGKGWTPHSHSIVPGGLLVTS